MGKPVDATEESFESIASVIGPIDSPKAIQLFNLNLWR